MAKDLGKQLEMQLALNEAIKARQDLLKQQNSLLQNQATLEKQLSSMYGDKARDSSTLADNMRTMSDEARKTGKGTKDQNKSMDEQIKLADRLRSSQDKNNKKAREGQKETKKQEASWKDLKKAATEYFKELIKRHPAALAALVGMQRAVKDIGTAFSGIGGLIGSAAKGIFNIGKALLAVPFKMIQGVAKMQRKMAEEAQPLRDAIEGVRKAFGGLNSEMGSKVMDATKKFSMGAKSAALGGRSLMSMFGYRSAGKAKFVEALTKTMAGLNKLAPMIARTFSPNKMMEVMAYQKAFELSDEALAGFVKTAELAGQDATQALKKASQAAESLAKGTGLTAKEVMQGMGEMKADFVTFGHMADEEMAAAVVSVKQFGGSIKDLKAVADKFMNFENAAESLSTLNQAFGMQIDAMDMLKAKNPAEQIDKMRQAFFATGKSIEDMTMHEKKLLQQQTGLSDAMMQSAFSAANQGKSYDDLQKAADKDKKKKLDQTKVLKQLADALEKFTGLGQDLSGTGDALGKGFTRAISLHPAFRSLMTTVRKFLLEVRQFGFDLGTLAVDLLSDSGIIGGLEGMLDAGIFKKFRTDVIDALRDLGNYIMTGEGSPDSIAAKIMKAFTDLGDAQSAQGKKLFGAFERLGAMMKKFLGFVWEKFLGPALKDMAKFIYDWMWENKGAIIKALAPLMGIILGWVLLKGVVFALGGALVKAAIGKITAFFAAKAAATAAATTAAAGAPAAAAATGVMAKVGGAVMTGLRAIPVAGWVATAAITVGKGLWDGVKEYQKTGSAKKAAKMTLGSMVNFITFGLVSKETGAKIAQMTTLGPLVAIGSAIDEYKKTGQFKEAGKAYASTLISGMTFGLLEEDSVRLAMDKFFGRDFKDPVEQAYFDLKHQSSNISKALHSDAILIYESAKGYKEYVSAMEESRKQAAKTGKYVGLQDSAFQARQDARIAKIKASAEAGEKAAGKFIKLSAKMAKLQSAGGFAGRSSVDADDLELTRGSDAAAKANRIKIAKQMKAEFIQSQSGWIMSKAELNRKWKNSRERKQLGRMQYLLRKLREGDERAPVDILKDRFGGNDVTNSDLARRAFHRYAKVTYGAKIKAAEAAARESGITGLEQGNNTFQKASAERFGQDLFLSINGTPEQIAVEAEKMKKDFAAKMEPISRQMAQMGINAVAYYGADDDTRSKMISKLKSKDREAFQTLFENYKATADQHKGFAEQRKKFIADQMGGTSAVQAMINAQAEALAAQTGNPKDVSMHMDRAKQMIEQALFGGAMDGAIADGLKTKIRGTLSKLGIAGSLGDPEKEKLNALEAAARTVDRIEKLKDIPKRLATLRKTLASWDPKKTALVAEELFKNVKMVVEAINKAVTDTGLDTIAVTINANTMGDLEAVGALIKGVNNAMDARPFSRKQAVTLISNTKWAIGQFKEMEPDVKKMAGNTKSFIDAIPALRDLQEFFGESTKKSKTGLLGLMSNISASRRAITKFASNAPTLNKALGKTTDDGLIGVTHSAQAIASFFAKNPVPVFEALNVSDMIDDISIIAKAVDRFGSKVAKFNMAKFGKAGTVANVTADFIESYNKIQENLLKIAKDPMDLKVKLDNFADALALDKDTFQIKNEALNFTVNVEVKIDAEQLDVAIEEAKKKAVRDAAGNKRTRTPPPPPPPP